MLEPLVVTTWSSLSARPYGVVEGERRGCLHRVVPAASLTLMELSSRDTKILDFERTWWTSASSKRVAIHEQLGLSATRYYQVLHALIDSPEAMAYDPLVVTRWRKRRKVNRRARFEGHSAGSPR